MKRCPLYHLLLTVCFFTAGNIFSQSIQIENHSSEKYIVFGNEKMRFTLDYNNKVNISGLLINGQETIKGGEGIYSSIRTAGAVYSTLRLSAMPSVKFVHNTITVTGISYGDKTFNLQETWTFDIHAGDIAFKIDRVLSKAVIAEQLGFPVCMFNSMDIWEGAYQDYGGLAWFYLFNKRLDTYGVHSSASQFWNSKTGNGLSIAVTVPGQQVAMDYSRTSDDKLTCNIAFAEKEMQPRYDSGTHRRRFIRDRNDVWSPVMMHAGKTTQSIRLTYFNCNDRFGRGKLVGINGEQVSAVLNTIARIGVIDKQHFGGNSWHTPYGPICLHEQYIAQMGLGINDSSYLKGYQECLDFYRDHAIKEDGRVWPRWAYTNEDMMPGEVNAEGFYEAQWGYLLDSNPDYISNVAELYDQNGNLSWVRTHQSSCERALDWILKRDSNNNGLVEMMTDSHLQKRGSDWIDIVWASYENAFVNAKLYHALILWAGIERQLGNTTKAEYYSRFAEKLKDNFNKPVTEGGFWDEEKRCYVHWRDKDGSVHGNNMVTPVNFMAIAYGICTDTARAKGILDDIETQMQKENLFFWPICMFSYAAGEVNDWQIPFPAYENGDIFLSWGSVAVQAYAAYRPALALKYVKNVLAQYAKDGLAFQRYGRKKQDGLGDDILSGNCLSIVGLYQSIYGIHPLYNRFYLHPHITTELSGTRVNYHFRGRPLVIELDTNRYAVSDTQFKIVSAADFGFFSTGKTLLYFNGVANKASLKVVTIPNGKLELSIKTWEQREMAWTQLSEHNRSRKLDYQMNDLKPGSYYIVRINKKMIARSKSDMDGSLRFSYKTNKRIDEIVVIQQWGILP